jgi:hypothetical protein
MKKSFELMAEVGFKKRKINPSCTLSIFSFTSFDDEYQKIVEADI